MIRIIRAAMLALFITTTLVGCWKRDEGASTGGRSELLERIPAVTFGYLSWDTSTPAYERYRKSSFATSPGELLNQLDAVSATPEMAAATPLLSVFRKSGLFATGADEQEPIREGLVFAALAPDGRSLEAAVWARGNAGVDLKARHKAIAEALRSEQVPVTPESVPGAEAFSIAVTAPDAPFKKIVVAATAERLAIASSVELAHRSFRPLEEIPAAERGLEKLTTAPHYTRAEKALPGKDRLAIAYVDVVAMAAHAEKLPAGPSSDQIASVPLEAVMITREMGDAPRDRGAFILKPGEASWKKALKATGGQKTVGLTPADSIALISFDGEFIRGLKAEAMRQSTPEESAMLQGMLSPLDRIGSLGIALRAASGASPFPELLIVAEAPNAAEVAAALKETVGPLTASSGMPLSPWQQKEIAGAKAEFMMSPMGVGLFLASKGSTLVLATSESGVAAVLGGAAGNLSSTFKSSGTDVSHALAAGYVNFVRMADLVKSFQENLAMFTGGQTVMDTTQLDEMRKQGSLTSSLTAGDDVVNLELSYIAPAK